MIQLAIIEDDPVIRQSYALFLEKQADIDVQIVADSVEAFLDQWQAQDLDLVLSDIGLPGMNGIEGIRLIKNKSPETDVILITVFEDEDRIFKALCAGASGYLLKSMPFTKLKESIRSYQNGGAPMTPIIAKKVIQYFAPQQSRPDQNLTPKEKQVVQGLVDGLSYKLIADRYGVSLNTVCTHIKNIYRKLHVNSKAEVIAKSLKGEI